MKFKLQLASLVTLLLLSGFVLAIILAISYFAGYISWWLMISITLVYNFLAWLIGPYISTLMFKWFYKIEFYDYEQVKDRSYIKFLKKLCDEHNIKVPRIGLIRDQNPTAFTYGSASFNATIVITEGLFTFLNEKELKSVIAHEVGHIVNKDFIIMSIASTLLQVLYQVYVIFAGRGRRVGLARLGKKGSKKGNIFTIIGIISLIFYLIGTYIVLFLSRLREYYADQFAAKAMGDPNILSSALVKIAYGIASVPDTKKTAHLLNNTRAQGIFDFKSANEIGLVYHNAGGKMNLIEKALLFDLVSPWAWLQQLKSTHPLIGKRISRLCTLTNKPAFNFDRIINKEVDKQRIWRNFFKDFFVKYSVTFLTILLFIILIVKTTFTAMGMEKGASSDTMLSTLLPQLGIILVVYLVILIILSIVKIRYRYPMTGFQDSTVIDLMSDLYASPVRGRPVKLKGKAIGRGVAGFIFGEDMIFQDKSGFVYLNYESGIPLFGNLFFAWKKLKTLLMKPADITGWFLRGATHHVELYRFNSGGKVIKSYARFWYVAGLVVTIIFLLIIVFGLAFVILL